MPRDRGKRPCCRKSAPALAGQSCRQLAATFGLTKSTVSRWLQELREGCPTRVAGSAEIIAHAVARYDALYRKALEAWDLSQADKQTESVVEIETARGPKKKRTRRTESQAGAPVFLAEARRALDGIARIVARIAPWPGKAGVPLSGITAERDEYVGVPPRPGAVEAPEQELSHAEPDARHHGGSVMSTGCPTAARHGRGAGAKNCPMRSRWPASRRSVMSTWVSHRGRARSRRRNKNCPIGADGGHHGGADGTGCTLQGVNALFSAGFSALQPRPMVDMSDLIRGVPRRQNSEFGVKCPISIAAPGTGTAPGTGRSLGHGKRSKKTVCASSGGRR